MEEIGLNKEDFIKKLTLKLGFEGRVAIVYRGKGK